MLFIVITPILLLTSSTRSSTQGPVKMKRSTRSLQIAALLAATAQAQTVTSTIPVCPTALSTTITLPTTVTFCPGPHCNGGGPLGPQVTPPPNGVGQPGTHLGEYTGVGADGKTTVLGIYETVYDSLCESGLVPATWTITQPCPGTCGQAPHPTVIPDGFETKVVPCGVCGPHTSTVTLTQPCPTGPYASQTPSVGQAMPAAPAAAALTPVGAQASASAGASAMAQAGSGMASAMAGSGASAQSGPGSAQAGAGAGASAQAGSNGASANAGAGAGASAGTVSPANAVAQPGNHMAPVNGTAPVSNVTKPSMSMPGSVQQYASSASQTTFAGFTIFAGIVAAILL